MPLGHDILIREAEKIQSQMYLQLLAFIGNNFPKEKIKESDRKNGVRIVQKQCIALGCRVSRTKIKKWLSTRLYWGHHTIVMDQAPSEAIYAVLLKLLYSIPNKRNSVNAMLYDNFNSIAKGNETFSKRLSILEDIYRELIRDSNINASSGSLCDILYEIDDKY